MSVEVTVLGSAAAYPGQGEACSGYLVRQGDTKILLDCGTGVLSNLFRWLDPFDLSAIAVSHLHTDHYLDLYPLRYYLTYNEPTGEMPIDLYLPEGGEAMLSRLLSDTTDVWSQAFEIHPIRSEQIQVGELSLRFFPVSHGDISTFGVEITGYRRIVYSSDCQSEPELAENAAGADLLIAEATLLSSQGPSELAHLTAGQAAQIAAEAGVGKLLLTHFWPAFDRAQSQQEAEAIFEGPVSLAMENQVYSIG